MKKRINFAFAILILCSSQAAAQQQFELVRIFSYPTGTSPTSFGSAVAAIGNEILIGAPGEDAVAPDGGAVYLFEANTGKLLRTFYQPNPTADAGFGAAIAVHDSIVLIGAPFDASGDNIGLGAAFLFSRDRRERLASLRKPNASNDDHFGAAVAAGGNKLFIAVPNDDGGAPDGGAVYAFDRLSGALQPVANPFPGNFDRFGSALTIVGNDFLVGTPSDGDTSIADDGAAYLFDGNTLQRKGDFLGRNYRGSNTKLGFGSALASVGNDILVSRTSADSVLLINSTTGALLRRFGNPPANQVERFGHALEVFGNDVFISAPGNSDNIDGEVFLFDGPSGALRQQLSNPSQSPSDDFGYSLAASSNGVFVGAPDAKVVYQFGTVQRLADCVDFQSQNFSRRYGNPVEDSPGDVIFTENGIEVSVHEFDTGDGSIFDLCEIGAAFSEFGLGNAMRTESIVLQFDLTALDFKAGLVSFEFVSTGGANENISVNGANTFVGSLFSAPQNIAPGVALNVTASEIPGGTKGVVTLRGLIDSLEVGGTNLWLDNVCAQRAEALDSCTLTIVSPQNGAVVCKDSITVTALFQADTLLIFQRAVINNVPAQRNGNTLSATIPAGFGPQTVIAECFFIHPNSEQTIICSDTATVTRIFPNHQVVINEISYNPNYDDLGTERIELKNISADTVLFDNWALWISRGGQNTYWALPRGGRLAPEELVVIHWLAEGEGDAGNLFTGLPSDDGTVQNAVDGFWGNNSTAEELMTLARGATNLNRTAFAVAVVQLITPGFVEEFANACRMVDFAQIGGRVPASENVAVRAGLWELEDVLTFMGAGFSYEYRGFNSSESDVTRSDDFFAQPSPSFGFENRLRPPRENHLLISEICVRPRAGEFIEIFNPDNIPVALTDYFLTDNARARGQSYARLTSLGAPEIVLGDFFVKFPNGASIAPGEYQTIAFSALRFRQRYGRLPDYEILADHPEVRDMVVNDPVLRPLGANDPRLDDSDEAVILLAWDRQSDLIEDVDYIVWGRSSSERGPVEAVDKTGFGIDGIDASALRSYFDNDTPPVLQVAGGEQGHELLKSWQRTPRPREISERTAGGNGISGHDETSEHLDFAFKIGLPTPNAESDVLDLIFAGADVIDTAGIGNGDGILNPGELVETFFFLRNNAKARTGALFSILSTESPFVDILDSTAAFPGIPPGETQRAIDSFLLKMRTRPEVPPGIEFEYPDSIQFLLTVIDKESGEPQFQRQLQMMVTAGVQVDEVPAALGASSRLPNVVIPDSLLQFTVCDQSLLAFITLHNTGNPVDGLITRLNIENIGAVQKAGINLPSGSTQENMYGISILDSVQVFDGPLQADSLTACLKLSTTNGLVGETRTIAFAVPFISTCVNYMKTKWLVDAVPVSVIDMGTSASMASSNAHVMVIDTPPDTIATDTTNNHGRAQVDTSVLVAGRTYKLAIARTENIATPDTFFFGITSGRDDICCPCMIGGASTPCGVTPCSTMTESELRLLGDVAGNDAIITQSDCDAITLFASYHNQPDVIEQPDFFTNIRDTGKWRFKRTSGPDHESFIGLPTRKLYFTFLAYRLGDMNLDWLPRIIEAKYQIGINGNLGASQCALSGGIDAALE